jgi:hypothetical protein
VLEAVDSGYDSLPWRNEAHGDASVTSLSAKEKVEGIDLTGHIARVAAHDLAADAAHVLDLELGWRVLKEKFHLHNS